MKAGFLYIEAIGYLIRSMERLRVKCAIAGE